MCVVHVCSMMQELVSDVEISMCVAAGNCSVAILGQIFMLSGCLLVIF